MRWLVMAAAVAVSLAGCDRVFGLGRPLGADADADTGDAPPDAPPPNPCAGRSPAPLLCLDFDEEDADLISYTNGAPSRQLLSSSPAAKVELRSPSSTGPHGLWITSITTGRLFTYGPPAGGAMALDATFSLAIARTSTTHTGTTAVVSLGYVGGTPCGVRLEFDSAREVLVLHATCAGTQTTDVTPAALFPSGWRRVHVRLDLAGKLAEADVDGGTPHTLALPSPTTTTPEISFGATQPLPGLEVGLDDLTVTVP